MRTVVCLGAQLAPDRSSDVRVGFPDIRWHQTADYGYVPNPRMPNVFMSVAIDLPDFNSTYGRYGIRVVPRLVELWSSILASMSAGQPARTV